jgi:CheY-like chemotaxis protein
VAVLLPGYLCNWRDPPFVRILLIDDNEAVLETVSLMLSFDGHTVLTASSAPDGLARLEAGEVVDLVLTDFTMPDIGGLEVVRRVRLHWPQLHVGIITGSLDELPAQHRALDVLLTKPVNVDELREAIRRLR